MSSSIVSNLIALANAALVEALVTEIAVGDATRGGTVRAGLLQDDPTKLGGINVLTHPNDPNGASGWRHSVASMENQAGATIDNSYTIGGGALWYRRFTTQLEMFFPSQVKLRDDAQVLASTILSRAEFTLMKVSLTSMVVDDFGEYAIQLYVVDSYNEEGGGEGSFIWNGFIRWQVLTEKQ